MMKVLNGNPTEDVIAAVLTRKAVSGKADERAMIEKCDDLVRKSVIQIMDILKSCCLEKREEALAFLEEHILHEGKVYIPHYLDLSENLKAFFTSDSIAGWSGGHVYCGKMEEDGRPLRFLLVKRIECLLEERFARLLSFQSGDAFQMARDWCDGQMQEVAWLMEAYLAVLLEHQKYDTVDLQELERKREENGAKYHEIYSCYREGNLQEALEKMEMFCEMGDLMWEYYEICARKYVVLCRTVFAIRHVIYFLAVLRLYGHGAVEEKTLFRSFPDAAQLFTEIQNSDNLCTCLQRFCLTEKEDTNGDVENDADFSTLAEAYLRILLKSAPGKRGTVEEQEFQEIQLKLAAPILQKLLPAE